jgi:hypothetical protein
MLARSREELVRARSGRVRTRSSSRPATAPRRGRT